MPWLLIPPDEGPPLVEWTEGEPPAGAVLPGAVRRFLDEPGSRGRLREIEGTLCARLVAALFPEEAGHPALERVDLVLRPGGVLLRRTPLSDGPCPALAEHELAAEWAEVLPEQRDRSVLFVLVLDTVIDTYNEVLDEVRRRTDRLEEELLDRDPPLNRILAELLTLNRYLTGVRETVIPLINDIREFRLLRHPVARGLLSASGDMWLQNVELDLSHDVPASLAVAESRIASALSQLQGERSEATNRVVLLLTILTGAFFLPTLLAGLYGMNVPLPGQRSHEIFWWFIGVTAAFVAGATLVISKLRLWSTFRAVTPGAEAIGRALVPLQARRLRRMPSGRSDEGPVPPEPPRAAA